MRKNHFSASVVGLTSSPPGEGWRSRAAAMRGADSLFTRLLKYLILVNGAQHLYKSGRTIVPVLFVEVKELYRPSNREEQNARCDKQANISMPLTDEAG